MFGRLSDRLDSFIRVERNLYSGTHNNQFAFSLAQVSRYAAFVDIILARFKDARATFNTPAKRVQENISERDSTGDVDDYIISELELMAEVSTKLHLEIEAFFVFSALFLDKIAQFIEDYFGQARDISMRSHHKWQKNFARYNDHKDMHWEEDVLDLLQWLQDNVVEHRDKRITHLQNPRILFGTGGPTGEMGNIVHATLYPKESDQNVKSPDIDVVYEQLASYVERLIQSICVNREKSRYDLVEGQ